MIDDEICNLIRLCKIFFVFGRTIHHNISIQSPCLSSCPCRVIRIALCSFFGIDISCGRIVIYYVKRTVVGSVMVFDGCIGMGNGNFIKRRIAAVLCCPEQEFKVHHIINDYRKFPGTMIP